MMRKVRFRSLYWTFAGSFLLVLIITAILQVAAIHIFFSPSFSNLLSSQAKFHARMAADEIERDFALLDDAKIESILRSHRPSGRPAMLVFRRPDGSILSDRPLPPMLRRRLHATLSGERPRGRGQATPRPSRERAIRLETREPIQVNGQQVGELIGITWRPRAILFPPGTPRPVALFLPIAIAVAAIAGMILFRNLLRRIRALETLAMRVTEGDLEARVPNPKSDEIGRLGGQLNRMTESLALARQRIDDAERQRRRLLGDISHELATPLTSIRGYTETLLNPDIQLSPKESEQYLQDVLEEANRMDLLIQDLLELTRLEAGAIELSMEPIDWIPLCQNTISRFRTRFAQGQINIEWETSIERAWVKADGRRLEQVLDNLLINALRYVPAGGTVTVSLRDVPETPPSRFRLVVEDDGPGFPPEDLPHVFDRFYRADTARSSSGSGLGLAIVREIVRLHAGDVRAANRSPSGASITVELPAYETASA